MRAKKQSRGNKTPASQPDNPIPRVNELINTAKINWLALLAYLSFIGITLMGVEDADFFLTERKTSLPLVGVTVPTALFFYIAPTLGAMLYIHLHLYLMKLWRALGELPLSDIPIAERISPWIVAEMALGLRPRATFPYPLRWLGSLVAMLSIFAAGPTVLAAFWWWSMPKHDEALTVLACGMPLLFCLLMGVESWNAMRRGQESPPRRTKLAITAWSLLALVLSLLGWMRTEGTLANGKTPFPGFLASAELSETVFVQTPPGWLPRDEAEQVFRFAWCKDYDIAALACGKGPLARDYSGDLLSLSDLTQTHRSQWCEQTLGNGVTGDACKTEFKNLDAIYILAWTKAREYAIATLPKRDFSDADLRGGNLRSAQLDGANLEWARLDGANLIYARLEGANLIDAQLEGANLEVARLEGADFRGARLEGANLMGARLDGANLSGARLEGAKLGFARLQGTNLMYARLEGANLTGARLDGANLSGAGLDDAYLMAAKLNDAELNGAELNGADIGGARLDGANLSDARLQGANLSDARLDGADLKGAQLAGADLQGAWLEKINLHDADEFAEQLQSAFGDGSTRLPVGVSRPSHWPTTELWEKYYAELKKWRSNPTTYRPPAPQ